MVVVTLELPDDVADRAHTEAARSGRTIEAVLADWLGQTVAAADVGLDRTTAYPILTPLGNEAAARALLDALAEDEARRQ